MDMQGQQHSLKQHDYNFKGLPNRIFFTKKDIILVAILLHVLIMLFLIGFKFAIVSKVVKFS